MGLIRVTNQTVAKIESQDINENLLLSPMKTFYSEFPDIASTLNRHGISEQIYQKF